MASLKIIILTYAFPALVLAAAFPSHAENIYQAGSEGDLLYKKIEYLLPPEVVPIFIPAEDPKRILKKYDHEAFSKSGISVETVKYMFAQLSDKMTAERGVSGYAITGGDIPGNVKGKREFCGIVFTSLSSQENKRTLMHEAIHCKNSIVKGTDAYMKAANPAWQLSKKLTARQFMVMLEEATAAGLQVAYAYNAERRDGLPMVQKFASYKLNSGGSFGYRTARGLLKLCGRKDACPTDTIGMINTIVQNKPLLNDLMTDMFEIQAAGEKAGFVVADQ